MITTLYRAKLIIETYADWISKDSLVLDIGCGDGIVASEIAKHFHCELVGTDIEDQRKIDIPFVLMEKKLPFGFDIAMLNGVLHHCPPEIQKRLIVEAMRVAKTLLVWELEPTFIAFITNIITNIIHYGKSGLPFYARKSNEWEKILGCRYRKARRPWWYPYQHFALRKIRRE